MTYVEKLIRLRNNRALVWDNNEYETGFFDAITQAIEVYKAHSDWIPVSEKLPPMGKEVYTKHLPDGHYHLCYLDEDYEWIGQYGETYHKDEMVSWKYFEPDKENEE